MFSKAYLSPKGSAPKTVSYTSPKGKDTSFHSIKTVKGKTVLNNDSLDHKESYYGKENQQYDNESLMSTQIGSTSQIASDTAGSEGVATIFNEKYCKKVLEEMLVLRREMEQKDNLIDKLMKENGTLRHEMEEFVNAVDDARECIDAELKECNQRIVALEAEVHEVRQENKQYKEEFERRKTMTREVPKKKEIEQEADGFYTTAQKTMEDFYFRLNEQLTDFMSSTQKQHQDFNKSLHKRIQGTEDDAVEKVEQTKPEQPVFQYSSPVRTMKQSVSSGRSFFEATKSPKGMQTTPISKKSCSKQNLDHFLSHTTEVTSPSSYCLYNNSPAYTSVSQSDRHFEDQTVSVLSDFNRSVKKSMVVSPSKTGLLRTKLKSDAILQEMKKRLSGA